MAMGEDGRTNRSSVPFRHFGHMAVGQNQWYHFGVGDFRTYFSGWIAMFTGGTIRLLTYGHVGRGRTW